MANFNTPYGYGAYNSYNPSNNYQQQTQMNHYAFVNGIEGAKSFQLQPNQTIMLMDSDNPICYMKQSNNIGQSTLRYFKLVEVSEQELRSANQMQPNADYVLNMMYSDYYGAVPNDTNTYIRLALKFLEDKDAKEGKAYCYYMAMKK